VHLVHTEGATTTYPNGAQLQAVATKLAKKCGGHALALKLLAGAVQQSANMFGVTPGIDEWRGVLKDLNFELQRQSPDDYCSPLLAYDLSVKRLSSHAKSILSTLRLFPAVRRVPLDMVQAIWQAQPEVSPADCAWRDGTRELARTSVVDQHKSAGGPGGMLFVALEASAG
jgi:hypothetical protein